MSSSEIQAALFMRGIIKAAAWIGHAKGDQHPYRHSFQPDVGVADTAQALIKIAHPSDSRYQARPALMMVSSKPAGTGSSNPASQDQRG